jgi:hypothetical protein
MRRKIFLLVSILGLAVSAQPGPLVLAQDANPIVALAGRWAGAGTMTPASGPKEIFRCVVTYFPGEAGATLRQYLRCKSANYQLEGAAQLKIAGGKVTGSWHDKVNSLRGTVSGSVKPDGFLIFLSGEFFDAKMTVASSACQQSVSIILEEGLPIKNISAVLRKC